MTALDDDYLTGYAHDQQTAARRSEYDDRCAYCRHSWHGFPCTTFGTKGCACPTSYKEAA